MTFKHLNATTGQRQKLRKPNWLLLKAAGVSKGKALTGRSAISVLGTVVHESLLYMGSDGTLRIFLGVRR